MPNWSPNWQDVRWNWGAADQAASELRRVADSIERASGDRTRAAAQATEQWRGQHRLRFDSYLQDALARARAITEEYRDAAGRIDAASHRARDEQSRRERDRARWRAEMEAEDRRRRDDENRRQNHR